MANFVCCSRCGKRVSNDTGVDIVVQAFVECPECVERSSGKEKNVKPKVLKASDVVEKESWSKTLEKPSEEFMTAICNEGSCVVTCELCGTTVFGSLTPSMYESGELQELQKKAATDPTKFVEWSNTDTVWFGRINGKIVIPDHSDECDKKISTFERWIVSHRYIIAKFLNGRGNSIVADAKVDAKMYKPQ